MNPKAALLRRDSGLPFGKQIEPIAVPSTAASIALLVVGISGQCVADENWFSFPGDDRRSKTARPSRRRGIHLPDRIDGEVAVRAFQFLQTHDVRLGCREPSQQVRKGRRFTLLMLKVAIRAAITSSSCGNPTIAN